MATGIPEWNPTKRNGALPYHIAYDGKMPAAEVLQTEPADLSRVALLDGPEPNRRLILGDNLPVLAAMAADEAINGTVRLIYVDPPFGTNSRFEHRRQHRAYDDFLVGASYLEFLRQRLIFMRELLAENGSIYVHLDDRMAFAVKVLMDEVFGPTNFRSWITRRSRIRRTTPVVNTATSPITSSSIQSRTSTCGINNTRRFLKPPSRRNTDTSKRRVVAAI